MSILPAVRANLVERYIFNFRLPPTALANHLPVSWLVPQVLNGASVVSFLRTHHLWAVTVARNIRSPCGLWRCRRDKGIESAPLRPFRPAMGVPDGRDRYRCPQKSRPLCPPSCHYGSTV